MVTDRKGQIQLHPAASEETNALLGYTGWFFRVSDIAVNKDECKAVAKTLARLALSAGSIRRADEAEK